jgi:hypothetical protein
MAKIAELLSERFNVVGLQGRRGTAQVTDPGHFSRLLRACRERPASRRAAEKRDELAPPHSITGPERIMQALYPAHPAQTLPHSSPSMTPARQDFEKAIVSARTDSKV